jgi:hypothetical protein
MSGSEHTSQLVSIIIVTYNGADVLGPCLRSVFAQPYVPIEVIIVDNGSTDGSAEMAAKDFPRARFLPQGRNLGFAEGNNVGVAAAQGDYVILLNNDTEVEPGWIAGLMRMLDIPGVAAVTSRVVTDGVPEEFYTMNGTVNVLGYNIMRAFSDLSQVFFAGGASVMFRKSTVGRPFLPEYFLYQEDLFLSWRLRLSGLDVRMAQDSVVHHRGSVTAKRQPGRSVTFYQERNRLLNCILLYGRATLGKLAPLLVADALAKTLLSILTGRKSLAGILSSYVWCVQNVRWIRTERAKLQLMRRVPDSEILRWMSSKLVEGNGFAARIINASSRGYATIAGLQCHD